MARDGLPVVTSSNVSRETRRRRAGGEWLNQKQVFRGWHEREYLWPLKPLCPERHGEEEQSKTGSIRGMCSTEGTRGGLVTNSTNVSWETRSRKNGGDCLKQKLVFRGGHGTEYWWLLVPLCPGRHGEELVQTGSTKSKCAAEGSRGRTSDY